MTKKQQNTKENTKENGGEAKKTGISERLIKAAILIVMGFGVPRLLALFPKFIQTHYTERLYPGVRQLISGLTSLTDVSITEIFFFVLCAVLIALLTAFIFKLFLHRITWRGTLSFWAAVLVAAGIILNLFNIVGGLNYHNVTLDKKLGLTVKPRTNDQLYGYCIYLRGEAKRLRAEVDTDENGIFCVEDTDAYLKMTAHEVECVNEINTWLISVPAAKQLILPEIMTSLGLSGIFMPFFFVSNVNTAQPSLLIFSSAAHENFHYLGIMREDEANFCAYLACASSDDANIAYSGVMLALMECSSRLCSVDKNLFTELINGLDDGVKADWQDYLDYWHASGDSFVSRISSAVNDAYLKYNGAEDGEKSYGGMVDLLLAYYSKCSGE